MSSFISVYNWWFGDAHRASLDVRGKLTLAPIPSSTAFYVITEATGSTRSSWSQKRSGRERGFYEVMIGNCCFYLFVSEPDDLLTSVSD